MDSDVSSDVIVIEDDANDSPSGEGVYERKLTYSNVEDSSRSVIKSLGPIQSSRVDTTTQPFGDSNVRSCNSGNYTCRICEELYLMSRQYGVIAPNYSVSCCCNTELPRGHLESRYNQQCRLAKARELACIAPNPMPLSYLADSTWEPLTYMNL